MICGPCLRYISGNTALVRQLASGTQQRPCGALALPTVYWYRGPPAQALSIGSCHEMGPRLTVDGVRRLYERAACKVDDAAALVESTRPEGNTEGPDVPRTCEKSLSRTLDVSWTKELSGEDDRCPIPANLLCRALLIWQHILVLMDRISKDIRAYLLVQGFAADSNHAKRQSAY